MYPETAPLGAVAIVSCTLLLPASQLIEEVRFSLPLVITICNTIVLVVYAALLILQVVEFAANVKEAFYTTLTTAGTPLFQ
jgi:hypothetical protein